MKGIVFYCDTDPLTWYAFVLRRAVVQHQYVYFYFTRHMNE